MDQVHPNVETMNWMVIESGSWVTDARTGKRSTWTPDSGRGEKTLQAGVVEIEGDYRLTGESWSWESEKPKYDAMEDFRAAIRFVRSNA